MHYLSRHVEFEASHRYWNPTFSAEQNCQIFGKCVSPYGHGHNYILRVVLSGQVDRRTGMVINIKELDRILKELAAEFDHKFINLDHPAFYDRIPTTENLVTYMRERLENKLRSENASYQLYRVTLYEDPTLWADAMTGEAPSRGVLTKTFSFSAAHRLHSFHHALPSQEGSHQASTQRNTVHGHNYELEITVHGHIDPQTGMVMNLASLMHIVQTRVLNRFDLKHLNEDTEEFRQVAPTGENLVRVIWILLRPELGSHLSKVGLWETPKNYFEYRGE